MEQTQTYNGPERRRTQRRQTVDRREMIRFEPAKEPRRSGTERRKTGDVWGGRNGF